MVKFILRITCLAAAVTCMCSKSIADTSDKDRDDVYKSQNIANLEALDGKTIRKVEIVILDIFEEPVKNSFYGTVNSVKINTKEHIVRRELLFKEGDTFNSFYIKESERNLRTQRFLRNISIKPTGEGNFVDVKVTVQDTWTFIPNASYSAGDGSGNRSVGLAESNIGGFGKRAEILVADEADRRVIEGVYDDPRLLGSDLRLVTAGFFREDGDRTVLLLTNPFRTLLDKNSWSIDSDTSDTVGKLWELGDERYIYRQETHDFGARYTWSFGNPEVSLRRFSLGYEYQDTKFQEATLKDYEDVDVNPAEVPANPDLLAANRRYTGPSFGYESINPRFISMDYIDRFDRVDDYDIGDNFLLRTTVAPEALGSLENALLINMNRSAGKKFDAGSFIRGEFGFSTRTTTETMDNSLFRAESRYYNVLGALYAKNMFLGKHTFAFGYSIDYARDLDKDREFLLGGDNGLRGYEARSFSGDKRFLLNVEDRIHIAEDVLQLLSFGAAAFVDVGGTTFGTLGDAFREDLYADAGIGLRFAFPRSSGGRILRIDLAMPFREGPEDNGLELRMIFAGGQIFGSRLRSEILGTEKANVEVGTDR